MKVIKIANNLASFCLKQDNCLKCMLNHCCGNAICDWKLVVFDVADD